MRTPACGLFILLFVLLIAACSKKQECMINYSQMPGALGLVGFSSDEADTVVVLTHAADGRFESMQDSILVAVPKPDSMQGDTLRLVYGNGLVELRIGKDYVVRIPGAARAYRISGLGTSDADYTFEASDCPHGRVSYTAPGYAQINDGLIYARSEPHDPTPIPRNRFYLVK